MGGLQKINRALDPFNSRGHEMKIDPGGLNIKCFLL